MIRLAPNTFLTFGRGLPRATLADSLSATGHPVLDSGTEGDWAWVRQEAYSAGQGSGGWAVAASLTRRAVGVETAFVATTPPCACPHGQNYMVPHCPDHPFQFAYCRDGFEELYLNLGGRRESRRAGSLADVVVRELLDAKIVGRDTTRYDADPTFNADGSHTLRILAAHFGLPLDLT
ncbi:hypothetical protein OOK31_35900 [Streptomyces sp. NBC_00249]|uniref:hypothetical protein n=1 Tax=Streptomyces sp. NBC_00249 TaxID=2975690 RepID=UPI002256CF60|nr:hypothetical protein [Streptomyces sp. NBC_00249]MCX5199206.1 hypothetical protein [Streptomyces sp. NBC_00249]